MLTKPVIARAAPVWLLISCLLVIASCRRAEKCSTEEARSEGKIVSISGPDTVRAGGMAPLLIGVRVDTALCISRAEGFVKSRLGPFVQLGAYLVHHGADRTCDCIPEPVVYTLVYFEPAGNGAYCFSSRSPDSIGNSSPGNNPGVWVYVP